MHIRVTKALKKVFTEVSYSVKEMILFRLCILGVLTSGLILR